MLRKTMYVVSLRLSLSAEAEAQAGKTDLTDTPFNCLRNIT